MTTSTHRHDTGLQILDSGQLALGRGIDDVFLRWADEVGATERRYPQLIEVADLERFDYFENFPHLGLAVAGLDTERAGSPSASSEATLDELPSAALKPARYALPSAACYAVYLQAANDTVPEHGQRHTLAATCFRNETKYEGLARLLGFTMREVVFIGGEEQAKAHLETFITKVTDLCNALDLPMSLDIATDPFFDKNGSRALMQRLFPVKREFVVGGVAVGSVNYHRNFFGERCAIQLPEGEPAHTGCAAFGIERWVHALTNHFGDAETALKELNQVAEPGV